MQRKQGELLWSHIQKIDGMDRFSKFRNFLFQRLEILWLSRGYRQLVWLVGGREGIQDA